MGSMDNHDHDDGYNLAPPPHVQVNRPAFRMESFNVAYQATKPIKTSPQHRLKNAFLSCVAPRRLLATLISFFPIVKWLSNYNLKRDLLSDIICGVTIAVFQIPQGMAYAQLANQEPVYGLYASFFPVIIYFLMGTSRQLAMGTFAVGALMMGVIVTKVYPTDIQAHIINVTVNGTNTTIVDLPFSKIDIAVTVALWAGIFQLLFWLFRLGALSVYLSENLVSGFTCASALHILTSQVKTIFGLKLPAVSGPANLIITYVNLFERIEHTNVATILLSLCAMALLILFKEIVNPRLKKYFPVPFPIELVLVIAGTATSAALSLQIDHRVSIVGNIPIGLPAPQLAPTRLMSELAVDSLVWAIVCFSQTVSLGKIFAKKYGYEIDANQELLTLGTANIVGSFFFCVPTGGSLSRSSVQDAVGGKTQLVSGISCIGILVFLLAIGPLLHDLPNCILSAIIVVSLKGMLSQVFDLKRYWTVSKADGLTWLITFISVFALDVDIGLGIGVAFSLVTLVIRSQRPKTYVMGVVEHTDVYVPLQRYLMAREVPGFKIFRFDGPLHFGNIEYFSKEILRTTRKKKNQTKNISKEEINGTSVYRHVYDNGFTISGVVKAQEEVPIRCMILDCSAIGFADTSGVTVLKEIYQEYEKQGISMCLASCSTSLFTMLQKDGFFNIAPSKCVFPTIQDAILFEERHYSMLSTLSSQIPMHLADSITKL